MYTYRIIITILIAIVGNIACAQVEPSDVSQYSDIGELLKDSELVVLGKVKSVDDIVQYIDASKFTELWNNAVGGTPIIPDDFNKMLNDAGVGDMTVITLHIKEVLKGSIDKKENNRERDDGKGEKEIVVVWPNQKYNMPAIKGKEYILFLERMVETGEDAHFLYRTTNIPKGAYIFVNNGRRASKILIKEKDKKEAIGLLNEYRELLQAKDKKDKSEKGKEFKEHLLYSNITDMKWAALYLEVPVTFSREDIKEIEKMAVDIMGTGSFAKDLVERAMQILIAYRVEKDEKTLLERLSQKKILQQGRKGKDYEDKDE